MKPDLARVEHCRLALVDVHAENIVAYLGHAGGVDGAQVAASDYGKFHLKDLPQKVEAISCRIRQQ
jgi:hypothetical protein